MIYNAGAFWEKHLKPLKRPKKNSREENIRLQSRPAKNTGSALVVEAGKTRRQVALRAKKELEVAGGRLLGVILNKRKHYIPHWIYRRL